jgi:hypothetical protein
MPDSPSPAGTRGLSPRRGDRPIAAAVALLAVGGLALAAAAGATDLGSGELLVAGTRLVISPESQTVPFDTPTIVETHLEGFDPANGSLPPDLRVLADFSGPELGGVLELEAAPNEPLRIPRLRLEGEYLLENIRLMQGDDLLAYASPRSAVVRVTQILVTRVTSRPLTLDEIRSYGIVVDDDNFQAFNFTFGFAVEGDVLDYNVPIIFLPGGLVPEVLTGGGGSGSGQARFRPPQMAAFRLDFPAAETTPQGGCQDPSGDCTVEQPPPLPGVILFPTDLGLLHQFFSVMLMVQNGAPAGDPLVVRDLTARIKLPPGLRQAETQPPTPLGVPVPVRVPGPDGVVGTADDLTFLIAQASGEADFLVEGLKEGTHVVEMDLSGVLEGLPGGIRHLEGTARGAVVVRDPTFGVTISQPDVVRADEEFSLYLTLSNTSVSPANLVTVSLPLAGLSGVEVVGDRQRTIDSLLPGDSEVVEFRLRSLRTGRVTAASARSDQRVNPTFELTVGVGENGIPLSPTSIVLPRSTESLPPALVRQALSLIGLGFSLATAPPSLLAPGLPRVSRGEVDARVYELAQAGRQVAFGEELFDAAAVLAAEWTGARDGDFDWDELRRTTEKGALVGDSLAQVFAAAAAAASPRSAFERFAATTGFLPSAQAALVAGGAFDLTVVSRTSNKGVSGAGIEADRVRDLPFADLYRLGADAQMALLAVPEEGGYQAQVRVAEGGPGGTAALELLVPDAAGSLRTVRWDSFQLSPGGVAEVDFSATAGPFTLFVDENGDGIVDDQLPGSVASLARRPFTVVAAVENSEIDPSGHIVEVLFSQDVDVASLLPRDPDRFEIPGKVSNGGLIQAEADLGGEAAGTTNPLAGLMDSRVVRVVFNNPISPYVAQELTVRDVASTTGEQVSQQVVPVVTNADMPGTLVAGRVIGPDGEPAPFAQVDLIETDECPICLDPCRPHKTAAVQADAQGEFLFDYVRQTPCGDLFTLQGQDPATAKKGSARGRVRFIGQTVRLDIVMLGRGSVRGRVLYDDGTVPANLDVQAVSPAFQEGRRAVVDANGNYEVGDLPVGTITLTATDGAGNFSSTSVELASAGAVVDRDLTILRRPDAPTGEARGTVFDPDGVTPVFEAWVALYVDGDLIRVLRSDLDGRFDFGLVPAGQAEIEAFSGESGRSGARVFFTVPPDAVAEVDVLLRDERGDVEGHVYRETSPGVLEPQPMAVVWAAGTPFNTTTDAAGFYRLEGVFAGLQSISAADLSTQQQTSAAVTVVDGETATRDLVFPAPENTGGVAGEVLDFDGNPVFGATVHIALGDQNWAHETFSDGAGQFSIPDLAPGVYDVHAFRGASGGHATAQVRFAGDTPFITIRFKKGTIRGQVEARDESGELVGVQSVVRYRTTVVRLGLVGLDVASHDLETDEEGNFELTDVLAGDYVLTAFNSFYGEQTIHGELVANGEVADHQIVFERNGTITGTVRNWDGTPAAGALVDLRHPGFSVFDVATDADGRFTFDLVPPTSRPFPIDATFEDGMVFRQGRVWVRFNQYGQQLDVEIVLPRQGSVSGVVEDSDGVAVPGATVTLKESEFPARTLTQEADADGAFEFDNVFAGMSTLSARALALGGLGGKTTVEIVDEGQALSGVVIRLEEVGEITGRIRSPVDGSLVPSAEVRLFRGGHLFDSATSDADGAFDFVLLPLGAYEVRAFDPASGRAGRESGLVIASNGEVVDREVFLEARGSVDGHLYEPASSVPVPGAAVTLRTQSLLSITTYASTDGDGHFLFDGIPQGNFTLSAQEPGGRRRASGGGEIAEEDQQVTVDLYLEQSGSVTGTVLNPPGLPAGPFSPADVALYQDGQLIGSSLEPEYHFEGIIAGRGFRLDASEPGGLHRGSASGVLNDEGEDVQLDVQMRPLGSVAITVVDAFGAVVAGADVRLTSSGPYGGQSFAGTTGGDGVISFADVGEGSLSAYATDPATQLGGSTTGSLSLEGQEVALTVQLQDSGEVRGTVLLADGATPAADALAVLAIAGHTYTVTADAAGAFSFPSVPLGSFTLDFQQSFGPGTLRVAGAVTANGEVVDLGTLVLDDADPEVLAIAPPSGSSGVGVDAAVTVDFSEPIDTGAFQSSWITLRRTAGGNVAVSYAFAADGATVILTPDAPLGSFTSYQVKVSTAVADLAGRHLDQAVTTSFTTADVVPPAVAGVSPADGAVQVPVEVQLVIDFSEAITLQSLSGSALQLTDLTAGTGVTTTFTLEPAQRQVLLTPVAALAEDHLYQLTVQGVEDLAGNPMAAPFASTFATLDQEPPVVDLVAPEGPYTEGVAVALGAEPVASPDVVSVSFFKDQTLLATDDEAPYTATYTPSADDAAAGSVELSAAAVDDGGNVGPPSVLTRQVLPDLPPEVTVTLDPDGEVLPEGTLTVGVDAVDSTGLSEVRITLSGGIEDVHTFSPGGTASYQVSRSYAVPLVPAQFFVDVVVRAVDALGKVTETAPRRVAIFEDLEGPVFGAVEPPEGAEFSAGDPVSISAEVTDDLRVAQVSFAFGGQTFVDDEAPYEWTVPAPAVEEPTDLPITIEATDAVGNASTFVRTVRVDPFSDPDRPQIAIACPSDGALLAPGTGLDVAVDATDDQAVAKVEFFLGDDPTPAATDFEAPYTFRLEADPAAVDGDILELRAEVSDFGGKTAEDSVSVAVVEGAVVTATGNLDPADYEGQSLILVGAGLRTLQGSAHLRDLVLLDGATLTHPFTTTSTEQRLELTLDRHLYVGCGSAVDVSGRGYVQGYGYGNSTAEGASASSGGSHGGRAGGYDGSSPVYGSLFEPRDPGAGGTTSSNSDGGGAVAVEAAGRVVVDGAIQAAGIAFTASGDRGAGGSILLAGSAISGAGTLDASGAVYGGSGGRIALYGASVDDGLLSRTTAYGGVAGGVGGGGFSSAAAGTLFVKRDGQTYGDLIVDNGGSIGAQPTELLAVGRGLVTGVAADSFTDAAADFRHSLAGSRVVFNDDFGAEWVVTGNDHHGQTLDLDTSGLPLTAQVGDGYQGFYRFDHVIVRGGAILVSPDPVLSESPPEVEPGAVLRQGDADPGVRVVLAPGSEVLPGRSFSVFVDAVDFSGLASLSLTLSGAFSATASRDPGGAVVDAWFPSFNLPLALASTADQTVEVRVTATALDGGVTEVVQTITIPGDVEPPAITSVAPPDGTAATAGDFVTLQVSATDAVGLADVTFELAGRSHTIAYPGPYTWGVRVPPVTSPSSLPVTARATDLAGNVTEATWSLAVTPLADAVPPVFTGVCPGSLMVVPAGTPLQLSGTVSDDLRVYRWEALLDGQPVLSQDVELPSRSFSATLTVPPDATAGAELPLELVATDYGGNQTVLASVVRIVEGTTLTADTTLAAGDLSLDGGSLIVAGGTLTVEGPHSFADLVVLDGATVTHPPTGPGAEERLDLEIARDLYVGCGGRVDAAGRGYPGAAVGGLGTTYPNATTGGAPALTGGSHGGRGGRVSDLDPNPAYGNLFAPRDPGAGGGYASTHAGGAGGGVVSLAAGRDLAVDGVVTADGGAGGNATGGAGGSVLLAAATLGGAGSVSAAGGRTSSSVAGGGSGGRVALYGAVIDASFVDQAVVEGGTTCCSAGYLNGSAGTLFVKRDAQAFGDLIIDNGDQGNFSSQVTALLTVGAGFVDAVSADSITDLDADFVHSLAGVEVGFNGDSSELWPISAHDHHGQTLTFDVTGHPLTVQVGDSYRGVYRFDRVVIRGRAWARADDLIHSTSPPEVETGSVWEPPNEAPPDVDAGKVSLSLGELGLAATGEAGAVSDPDTPIAIEVTDPTSGEVFSGTAAADGSFSVPVRGADGDLLELVAVDGHPTSPLASAPLALGPLSGGEGLRPTVTTADSRYFDAAALGDGLAAGCSCFWNPEVLVDTHYLTLFDLSDPAAPRVASELVFGGSQAQSCLADCDEACDSSESACFAGCAGSPDPAACQQACSDSANSCYQDCRVQLPCEAGCFEDLFTCQDGCADDPDPNACYDACSAGFDSCNAGCQNECPQLRPPLPQLEYTARSLAIGDGIVVIAQGPYLRIVDARDPNAPELLTDLQVLGQNESFAHVEIVGGYLHALQREAPYAYLVFDLRDPAAPRLVSASTLPGGLAGEFGLFDGRLHRLGAAFGSESKYSLFAAGDPADPLLLTSAGPTSGEAHGLVVTDQVAAFLAQDQTATFHRAQPAGDPPHLVQPLGSFSDLEAAAEAGDELLVTDGSDVAVGHLGSGYDDHGFEVEQVFAGAFDGAHVGAMGAAGGFLWTVHNDGVTGYPSALLRPWLDASRVSLATSGTRVVITGSPGAAGTGAVEVTASAGGGSETDAVAADGSFSLTLTNVAAGARITLRAADAAGAGGNLLRLRVPAGGPPEVLALADGGARLAVGDDSGAVVVGAVVPATQDGATVTVPLVDLAAAGAPAPLGAVTVDGPVADAALGDGALYLAAARLEVFDVTDPTAPVAQPALDLYAGNPVLAAVRHGATLLTVGQEAGGGLGLASLDLTDPLAPAEDPAARVALPAFTAPRLVLDGDELWLIGDGTAHLYDLAGPAPVEVAAGSFPGHRLVDLQVLASGEAWVGLAGEGAFRLDRAGATLTLGPAPPEPHPVFGLFALPAPSGEQLWWGEGLAGAATLLGTEEPVPGVTQPVWGRMEAPGLLRDGVVAAGRLYLLTDFALVRIDVPDSFPAGSVEMP